MVSLSISEVQIVGGGCSCRCFMPGIPTRIFLMGITSSLSECAKVCSSAGAAVRSCT